MPYKDPEKRRAYNAAYRAAHREENRAYNAAYYVANREKESARNKAYRAANPEMVRVSQAAHRAANSEKRSAYNASYLAAHPAECAANDAKKRARKRAATIGDPKAIKAVYRRAREAKNVKCYLCGKLIPMGERHVDHIVPLSKGGAHAVSNLAVTHAKCNNSKGTKLPHEVGLLL